MAGDTKREQLVMINISSHPQELRVFDKAPLSIVFTMTTRTLLIQASPTVFSDIPHPAVPPEINLKTHC